MSLQVVQFQYGLYFLRLSYSEFVQSFQDVIMWDFRHRQQKSFPLRIEFLNIIISKNSSEKVGVVFDRIMGSSDPEVIVDQVGNLSTSKETVLLLGFFCSSRLILLLNRELWMILFSVEAILA